MPSVPETVAAVRLCFIALDVTPFASDASCPYLLGARTMGLVLTWLRRHILRLNMKNGVHLPGANSR